MTKILVIDDDAIVRMTVEHILRDAGYEVLTAENGLRGMAVFCSQQPDLVITDILMPEQEGIQTIAEMRKAKPDAKIIAISGGGHGGKVDFLSMARALGAMDVVPKPFDLDQLLAIVENCLASPERRDNSGHAA